MHRSVNYLFITLELCDLREENVCAECKIVTVLVWWLEAGAEAGCSSFEW